jgi:hypothetical protein
MFKKNCNSKLPPIDEKEIRSQKERKKKAKITIFCIISFQHVAMNIKGLIKHFVLNI